MRIMWDSFGQCRVAVVGAELLDGERSTVRVQVGGVEGGQPRRVGYLRDRGPDAERRLGGQAGAVTAPG
jgi:hypothetical protein